MYGLKYSHIRIKAQQLKISIVKIMKILTDWKIQKFFLRKFISFGNISNQTQNWHIKRGRGLKSSINESKIIMYFRDCNANRAVQEKQYSAVASNAKVLMKIVGLEAKLKS